jgi:putative hydrolase of the HAD superfamily
VVSDFDVLLLDFGGVCLRSPVELHRVVEDHFALPHGTFTFRGPLDPRGDELYARSIAGDITERDYWAMRAEEVGRVAGVALDTRGYMEIAYDAGGDVLIRPEADAVVARAQEAGLGVSVLTNDLRAFHGEEWAARIDFLARVDHVVDCSHIGFLKPDPRAYAYALDVLEHRDDPARILFVDDQPLNVEGGDAAGMIGHFFDIADAAASWSAVASRLGLRSRARPGSDSAVLGKHLRISRDIDPHFPEK